MNSSDQHHQDNKTTSLRLNEIDAAFHRKGHGYIGTISWLHGDYKSAEKELERRLGLMVKKNPWFLGRISPSGYLLTYMNLNVNGGYDPDLSKCFNVIPLSSSQISRQVPFSKLASILEKSRMILHGPHKPIFKVTVIPCSKCPEERFALFVQFSHAAGDGATYYKLFHMLCSTNDDDNMELIAKRISIQKQRLEALGGKDVELPSALSIVVLNHVALYRNCPMLRAGLPSVAIIAGLQPLSLIMAGLMNKK